MCIFSGDTHVAGTRIFARCDGDRAYQMELASAGDVAMVLPLPVAPGAGDGAVAFIDLSGYPQFFEELDGLFMSDLLLELEASLGGLEVHTVGEFEASYVPSIADFARLDRRFQLSPEVWSALPQYRDFGFAVFKLAAEQRGFFDRLRGRDRQARKVHPMAFSFPTRSPDKAFFPTVHVHDGAVHPDAEFDHELYCQGAAAIDWEPSMDRVTAVAIRKSHGVLKDGPVLRRSMHGTFDNADVYA
jgi:hypothetical protein